MCLCIYVCSLTAMFVRVSTFITSHESSPALPLPVQLCGIPSGSPSLMVRSWAPFASLLTCSVVESMAGALGSTHLHPSACSKHSFWLQPGVQHCARSYLVGSPPPLRLGQWLAFLLIRHQRDSQMTRQGPGGSAVSPVTGCGAAPPMAQGQPASLGSLNTPELGWGGQA